MTTSIYSVSATQSQILVDGAAVVTIDKVGGISSGVKATAISGLTVTQANQTPLPGVAGLLSYTHGLGAVPISAELELVCLTAEAGYSVGDVVTPWSSSNASYYNPISVAKNATTVFARTGSNVSMAVTHATTGATAVIEAANWAWRFKVRVV